MMSGGHWDYGAYRIQSIVEEIINDEQVKERFEILPTLVEEIGALLANIEHDLDWDLSGDSAIKDDKKYEKEIIDKLISIIHKVTPKINESKANND